VSPSHQPRVTAVGLGAAVVFITAACGSSGTGVTAAERTAQIVSSLQRYPMSGLQDYDTVRALVSDLAGAGLPCSTPLTLDSNSRYAVQQGRCRVNDTEMVFGIFSSDAQRAQGESVVRELKTLGVDYGFVEGGNWLVNCGGTDQCSQVKAIIGGRLEAS
jgi:hypothetical protein